MTIAAGSTLRGEVMRGVRFSHDRIMDLRENTMKIKIILLPLLLAPALSACANHGNSAAGQYVSFAGNTLVVKTPGRPDARIDADGALRIGNNAVAITPVQRALLTRYYSEVIAVRDDGIATGSQGLALGMHAIGRVMDNLAAGTPDKIDHDMDTRGKTVEITAQRMCGDLGRLRATQGGVVAQLPAFRPYAVFSGGINYFSGDIQCDEADLLPPAPPVPPVPPQPPKVPSPPSNSGAVAL